MQTSALLLAIALAMPATAQTVLPATAPTAVLRAYEALHYGMFIHFGMSTFTGHEFGGIPATSTRYQPTQLDVDQWIKVAADAGMKYAVLTTKHCYGHALWPTQASDYSVATSAVKHDVVRLFVDACRRHGVQPGFYYLLGWDVTQQARMTPAEYEAFCRRQLGELLGDYGPITELWLDIPWDMGPQTGRVLRDIYALVKNLQPDCLVLLNQGFDDGRAVVSRRQTYRQQPTGEEQVRLWPKDINNGEVTLPPPSGHEAQIDVDGKSFYLPMETCDTLARHWFFDDADALKTVPTLYRLYRACLDRKANLLLDAAPDRTGRLPAATVQRLMDLKRAIDEPATVPRNLLAGARATASNVYRNDASYGADKLTDADPNTRWATDDGVHAAWVEFDLGAATTFDSGVVTEGWQRVRRFVIEVPDDHGGWRAIHHGERIGGDGALRRWPAVTASKVRLSVLESTDGPTIWDFELYQQKR